MLKEKPFDKVPSIDIVRERIRAVCKDAVIEKAFLDDNPDTYVLRLGREHRKHADLRLSFELLDDLKGKNSEHRQAQLEASINDVINRLK
jgi:hypothetical protein